MTENPWEDRARNLKATRLANAIWIAIRDTDPQEELVSITALALPRKTWELAAEQLQIHLPSDQTIALAISIIQDRESLEQFLSETRPQAVEP